jgi:hypothetical protein
MKAFNVVWQVETAWRIGKPEVQPRGRPSFFQEEGEANRHTDDIIKLRTFHNRGAKIIKKRIIKKNYYIIT